MVLIPREPRLPTLGIAEIERENIDGGMKGMPAETSAFPLGEIGLRRWNILSEDLPFPLAVLKESALAQNSAWMRTFLRQSGALIAPHGKTTMSPQLFQRQLDDGAWGITVATVHQLRVCRRYGVQRVILANQLLGRTDIQYVIDELRHDPDFDFYCLVDSLESVDLLADSMRTAGLHRPLQLLLEVGFDAGRAGARGRDEALDVARRVAADAPLLTLRGVEGFEGLISGHSTGDTEASVSAFLDTIVEVAEACEALNLFGSGPVILTAGGSSYYDLVARCFARVNLGREVLIVVRSGCYLTHDSRMYADQIPDMLARSPELSGLDGPRAALELWAYVQSRPEVDRVILTCGKRDCSYDAGLPVPRQWYRPGTHQRPRPLSDGHLTVDMNDQHAMVRVPADSPLRFGDMVMLGISHPCTTFDKWQLLPVVDDDYNVVSAIRTFF